MFVYDKGLKPKRRQYMMIDDVCFYSEWSTFSKNTSKYFRPSRKLPFVPAEAERAIYPDPSRMMANNFTPNDIKMIFQENARNGLKAIVSPVFGVNETAEPSR